MPARVNVKHREIYEHIHRGIADGQFAVGQRIPTESELALQFDASRVTVARALRDLEQEGFLIRRRGAGSFVSQGRTEPAQLLGMICPDTPGIFSMITDFLVRLAQQNGLGILLGRQPAGDADHIMQDVETLCAQYAARKVAGVFFAPLELPPALFPLNARIADALERAHIPVVLLDRDICDFPRRSRYDLVGIDNVNAGYVLTEHLISMGCRRIGFLRTQIEASSITARIAGYREALLAHGLPFDLGRVACGDSTDPEFVRGLIERIRPDGLVCVNDHEAAKLMRSLAALSVKAKDIAIVGMDDDAWATFLSASLTTVRQPCADLAAAAIELMRERMSQPSLPPQEVCLTCELIIRDSSRPSARGPARPVAQPAPAEAAT